MFRNALKLYLALIGAVFIPACAPVKGPDKQFSGGLQGAAVGAGSGAVTGFQVGAGTGPGALIGAGFGAVAGGIQGVAQDRAEEEQRWIALKTRHARETAGAQELLAEHYKRRLDLHPSRDIFPADIFFFADNAKLRPSADALLRELAFMNKNRLPWSRLVIKSYVRTTDEESEYAFHLARERARELGDRFVRLGIEPRRIEARAMLIDAPLVLDPYDDPLRYNQAIEFIMIDR